MEMIGVSKEDFRSMRRRAIRSINGVLASTRRLNKRFDEPGNAALQKAARKAVQRITMKRNFK